MARIRTIKPEFPQSESMGRVSREARLLFVNLWTICDDTGRARGNSRMLASLLYPYDDDAPSLIEGWLDELEREECVVRYRVDDASYIQVLNWLKHQKVDKPSKSRFPQFEESSRIVAKPREASSEDLGPRTIGPRTKDQGSEEDKSSSAAPVVAAPASPPAKSNDPPDEGWIPLSLVRTENADIRKILFDHGKRWLVRSTGKPPDRIGSVFGRWLKITGDDARRIWDLLIQAETDQAAEPISWIEARLKARDGPEPALGASEGFRERQFERFLSGG